MLVPSLGEPGARTEVRDELRKEVPKTQIGDEALRKRRERAEKVYNLFEGIGGKNL